MPSTTRVTPWPISHSDRLDRAPVMVEKCAKNARADLTDRESDTPSEEVTTDLVAYAINA